MFLMVAGLWRGQELAHCKVEMKIAGQTHETKPQYDWNLRANLQKKMIECMHIHLVCSTTSFATVDLSWRMIVPFPTATMQPVILHT